MSDWVQIIHPATGGVAEVNRSALYQHYQSGWRLLADDEIPRPEPPPEPEPMSKTQAAQAASAESEE